MIDIVKVREVCLPGDFILTGSDSFISKLIRYGQIPLTADGKPSRWSHILFYIDSDTIAESTMDFKPYPIYDKKGGKKAFDEDHFAKRKGRMDNGPQYNDLSSLSHVQYGLACCFEDHITHSDRQRMLNVIEDVIVSGEFMYDLTGLLGSLLAYRLNIGSNPFSHKYQMYCSAFFSYVLGKALGIDPTPALTDRNTAPEHAYRWAVKQSYMTRWSL